MAVCGTLVTTSPIITSMETDRTPYRLIAGVAGIAALAFFIGIFASGMVRKAADAPEIPGFLWPNPPEVANFSLTAQDGKAFSRSDFLDKWSFVFFGFTQCPDVCPTTMQTLKHTKALLATDPSFNNLGQIVFVSVDPERDTLAILNQYLNYFDEDFIGITGAKDKLTDLTKPLGILFAKIDDGSDNSYTMDHSASILLIDPQGRVLGLFSMPHDPQQLSDAFKAISTFYDQKSS